MRNLLVAMFLLALPVTAFAQSAQPVPVPTEEIRVDGYRVLAIAAGAVGGVVVANAASGGLITPWLTMGMATGGTLTTTNVVVIAAARTAVVTAGAVAGGFLGNWLYGD